MAAGHRSLTICKVAVVRFRVMPRTVGGPVDPALRINPERLLDRLDALAQIGGIEGTAGSSRLALTDEDRAGRELVAEREHLLLVHCEMHLVEERRVDNFVYDALHVVQHDVRQLEHAWLDPIVRVLEHLRQLQLVKGARAVRAKEVVQSLQVLEPRRLVPEPLCDVVKLLLRNRK